MHHHTARPQMARHAYLILAHGQYTLLSLLIGALDDPRNDIYVHLDAKSGQIPQHIRTRHAELHWLSKRVDVRWGDVSIVRAELDLLAAATARQPYAYYHILSGVDLPIKSQDYIHHFFETHAGKEFVGYYHGEDLESSLRRKVRRQHLFARHFRGSGLSFQLMRIARAVHLRIQECLGIERHTDVAFRKGTQWVSITDHLARQLVSDRGAILELYRDTFCSDEIFIQTYLAGSELYANVFDPEHEGRGCMREVGWCDGVLQDFSARDLTRLKRSTALFARKFNETDMDFLHAVLRYEE